MIEVVSRVVSHAELLHDAPGPHVGRDRERHQLFQPEHLERVTNNFPRALCGQSLALIVGGQSPPNLDAWSEVGMERGNSKADETDKAAVPPQLRAVQAETVLSEMTLDLIYQPIAFLQRKSAGHELHHTRVRVQPRKRLSVRVPPASQKQPLSCQDRHIKPTASLLDFNRFGEAASLDGELVLASPRETHLADVIKRNRSQRNKGNLATSRDDGH